MKKKTTKKPTIISFILDESGSMDSIKDSVISGFNEYVSTLKKQKGDFLFTLTKFDSVGVRVPYKLKAIKDVAKLSDETYRPGQMTPLYDAVCKTIKDLQKEVKTKQPVLVAIMTDGEENSSMEYTQKELEAMIKELQADGNWTFVFMGANQDSWAVAQKIGITRGNTMDWESSAKGVNIAYASMGLATQSFSEQVNLRGVNQTKDFFVKVKKVK